MRAYPPHDCVLKSPLDAATIWKRLSTVLPALVRIFVRERHSEPLPGLSGPTVNGTTHAYEATESRCAGVTRLLEAGQPDSAVNLTIIQTQMIVLLLSTGGPHADAIERITLECSAFNRDKVLELLRPTLDLQ